MRWTAPMKAPSPPPTMPRRIRSSCCALGPALASIVIAAAASESEHALDLRRVAPTAGEVVEGFPGDPDDVVADERGALGRAGLRVLQAALPFEHRPAVVVVLRHLREDRAEIDLAVAERAKPP